jgi:hypothetical protein
MYSIQAYASGVSTLDNTIAISPFLGSDEAIQ